MATIIDYSAAQKALTDLQASLAALTQNDVTRSIQQHLYPVADALDRAIATEEYQQQLQAAQQATA